MTRERRRRVRRAIGLATAAILLAFVVFGWTDPTRTDLASRLAGPCPAHWLGQDGLRRDVLERVTLAARVSFNVAVLGVAPLVRPAVSLDLFGSCAAPEGGDIS